MIPAAERRRRARRATLTGIAGNTLLFAVKGAIGVASGSIALLSDAFNSLVDVVASVAIWYSVRVADRAPDADHLDPGQGAAWLREALDAGATRILLDNFTVDRLETAAKETAGRAKLEASGGISLENIRRIAETGVDFISIGDMTKNICAVDFSMRFETGADRMRGLDPRLFLRPGTAAGSLVIPDLVTVLDVRAKTDGRIEGAGVRYLHVPADAVLADPGAVASSLDEPVAVLCARGATAQAAGWPDQVKPWKNSPPLSISVAATRSPTITAESGK